MNVIFIDFLGIPLCKKPLNAYYIQETIHWFAQSPQSKISHQYSHQKPHHLLKILHDMDLVYR